MAVLTTPKLEEYSPPGDSPFCPMLRTTGSPGVGVAALRSSSPPAPDPRHPRRRLRGMVLEVAIFDIHSGQEDEFTDAYRVASVIAVVAATVVPMLLPRRVEVSGGTIFAH